MPETIGYESPFAQELRPEELKSLYELKTAVQSKKSVWKSEDGSVSNADTAERIIDDALAAKAISTDQKNRLNQLLGSMGMPQDARF